MKKLNAREYERYKSAIRVANEAADKEALRQIQKQLIVEYGLSNADVQMLLKMFRFNV